MQLFKRENYLSKIRGFYQATDLIKAITGIRRCGKSSILETIKDELVANGVSDEQIIFINLDKKEYKKIKSAEQLEEVIDSLSRGIAKTKYLFIDEIQNVNNFEELINAYREEGDYSIFITGSNSYLLSGELVTKLTGRYIEFEIYTLTFEEYIAMKEFYHREINPNMLAELNNYILEGGFPRTVLFDNIEDKRAYVTAVVGEIFDKDIKKRVKIRNVAAFELIRNYIVNNFGATTSLNNILKGLNANGFAVGKATLTRYIRCLVDAKILYECDRFDMKSKRTLSGEKKYYLGDLSLAYVSNPDSRINYGPILENIVYIYARSKKYTVAIGRIGKLECDFILKDPQLNYSYVQVAYSILFDRKTEDREYAPLEAIRDNYPKYVVTTDYLQQKRNGIRHVNLMEHLKNGRLF